MEKNCNLLFGLMGLLLLASISACSVQEVQSGNQVARDTPWVVLPFRNYAEAPKAGERVEAMVATLLRARGVDSIDSYPQPNREGTLPELDERRRYEEALVWAREQDYLYAVSGTVTEWRYKAGLDGEPAAGLNIEIADLKSGEVVWSGAGSRSGWGRESVSGACQRLLDSLLDDLWLTTSGDD